MKSTLYRFTVQDNGLVKPKIPIKLSNPQTGQSLKFNALLDTGSDSCVIPAMTALTLGLKLDGKSEAKNSTIGISGEPIRTWKHLLKAELLDNDWQETKHTIDIIVSILDPKIRNQPILGTFMFLEKFTVTLNYPNQIIKLEG